MGYIVMSYTANDVKALRDKTYCSLKKCKEAFDYADTHKDCTPEGYLRAIHNAVATPGLSFEERVRRMSKE